MGLDGFRVLDVTESDTEVRDHETSLEVVGCFSCGTRAQAQDRVNGALRDEAWVTGSH